LYERTGLSTDKESIIGRARSQDLPPSIVTLLRDPYVLEFAGLAERPSYSEADSIFLQLLHLPISAATSQPGQSPCSVPEPHGHSPTLVMSMVFDPQAFRTFDTHGWDPKPKVRQIINIAFYVSDLGIRT
jgi:hypothetical protein